MGYQFTSEIRALSGYGRAGPRRARGRAGRATPLDLLHGMAELVQSGKSVQPIQHLYNAANVVTVGQMTEAV
jgi:hypothetical protein